MLLMERRVKEPVSLSPDLPASSILACALLARRLSLVGNLLQRKSDAAAWRVAPGFRATKMQ